MRVVASSSSASTTRAPAQAPTKRRPAARPSSPTPAATRSTHSGPSPASVSAEAIWKASGDAAPRERLDELLLAIARGERVEALARHRLLGGLRAERGERGELLRGGAGSRDLGEGGLSLPLVLAQRRDPPGGGGGGVVQLVREPGGELADREQLLAVALDPLDRAAHRLDRGQEPAEQRGVREREPAELLPVQLEQDRLGDGAGAPAVGGVREQRHRARGSRPARG